MSEDGKRFCRNRIMKSSTEESDFIFPSLNSQRAFDFQFVLRRKKSGEVLEKRFFFENI